jgi:hypothetical protein
VTGERDARDDPWEGVVFDEEFVKGGRHEPPARTRESIARYGGRRTSWRQGALLEPVPVRRRARLPRPDWRLTAAVMTVVALAWYSVARVSSAPEIPAVAAPVVGPAIVDPAARGTVVSPTGEAAAAPAEGAQSKQTVHPSTAVTTDVDGVSEFDAIGTCYLDPRTGEEEVRLDAVDCTAAHNLELVSHRTATGNDDEYPDARYWQQVVGEACTNDVSVYLGTPLSGWPTGLSPYWLVPKPESWAFGHRHVSCMVQSNGPATTSVLDRTAHA